MSRTYKTKPIHHLDSFKERNDRHYLFDSYLCTYEYRVWTARGYGPVETRTYKRDVWLEKPGYLTKKKRESYEPRRHFKHGVLRNGPTWFRNTYVTRPTRCAWHTWEKKILRKDLEDWDRPRKEVSYVPYFW